MTSKRDLPPVNAREQTPWRFGEAATVERVACQLSLSDPILRSMFDQSLLEALEIPSRFTETRQMVGALELADDGSHKHYRIEIFATLRENDPVPYVARYYEKSTVRETAAFWQKVSPPPGSIHGNNPENAVDALRMAVGMLNIALEKR